MTSLGGGVVAAAAGAGAAFLGIGWSRVQRVLLGGWGGGWQEDWNWGKPAGIRLSKPARRQLRARALDCRANERSSQRDHIAKDARSDHTQRCRQQRICRRGLSSVLAQPSSAGRD